VVARPLLEYAERPWRDRHRDRFVSLAPDASSAVEPAAGRFRRVWQRITGGS
jgi:hypothetical protein